jgi:acyl-CoA thioester hydrolase
MPGREPSVEVEVWSGGVNTWECDEMGHLNVRFWVARSLEGLAGLAAHLDMPRAFSVAAGATLVVREQHIRFLREARAGATLTMTGGVVEMGEHEARLLLVVRHESGEPAATFQTVVAHVTAHDLRPFPWPARIRAAAAGLKVEIPTFAAARSLDLAPVATQAGLGRAEDLGLIRLGRGVLQPQECDVFGRMRGEMVIGRISDVVGRMYPAPEGEAPARVGGAVVEYRILHLAWPTAGDHLEIRSGHVGCGAKTRTVMHWLLDPVSGRPWASAVAVGVTFDLETRKLVEIPPEAQAAFNAQAVAGLGL